MPVSVDGLYLLQITKYGPFVSFTIAILEILSTLPDEVAFIWPGQTSVVKAVYFVNKYSVLVDILLAGISGFRTHDPQACATEYQALAYAYVVGVLFSETILIVRTMALWGFNRYVRILLIGGLVEIIPFTLYCVHEAIVWIEYPSNDILRVTGCVPATLDRDTWPAYACLILGETTIIALTILKRFVDDPTFEGASEGLLLRTMYRDGTFYYIIVLAMSILNLLVMGFAPTELSPSMQTPLRVVHSALCTHVLLNLRKAAAESSGVGPDGATKQSTLAFAPGPPGSALDHSVPESYEASLHDFEDVGQDNC